MTAEFDNTVRLALYTEFVRIGSAPPLRYLLDHACQFCRAIGISPKVSNSSRSKPCRFNESCWHPACLE
jgi:hypothetical protein